MPTFDLRPYDQTGPNSGTGFRQMADHAKEKRSGLPLPHPWDPRAQ